MMIRNMIGLYLVIMNAAAFFLYGMDKRKAIRNKWRIPEKTLLGVAFFGGSIGALVGMRVFHHKTKHWKFKLGVPACVVLHTALWCLYLVKI